jgi:hypothetical protein
MLKIENSSYSDDTSPICILRTDLLMNIIVQYPFMLIVVYTFVVL